MNLLRALVTVSGLTTISRVLGFIRDFFIARIFGAGLLTDAFFVAFRIPNLLRRLFAEGAFSQAFVPILAEYKNREGDRATHGLRRSSSTCRRPASPPSRESSPSPSSCCASPSPTSYSSRSWRSPPGC